VATITSGYLEACIAYALLIKALLCGGKRDLNLTICQLLNYGIFTALQRFCNDLPTMFYHCSSSQFRHHSFPLSRGAPEFVRHPTFSEC